jgi:hypothetical protein
VSRRDKDDWLRDINVRQRNVVFPDTVQNEGRFWRNIWSGKQSPSFSQWVGILIMLAAVAGLIIAIWPREDGVWWQKAINTYAIPAMLAVALGTFILIGNRRARRKSSKR